MGEKLKQNIHKHSRKTLYKAIIPISKAFMAPHSSEDQDKSVQLDKEPANKLSKLYLPLSLLPTNLCNFIPDYTLYSKHEICLAFAPLDMYSFFLPRQVFS